MSDVKRTEPVPDRTEARVASRDESVGRQPRRGTRRISVEIPLAVFDRMANAIYWTEGMDLSQFAEQAFRNYVEQLEKENNGRFQERKRSVRQWKHGKRRVDIVI